MNLLLENLKAARLAELRDSMDHLMSNPDRFDAFLTACFKFALLASRDDLVLIFLL